MFGIGANELILILLFGFLIFGPDKMPAMAKTLGQAIKKFRSAQDEMSNVIRNEVYDPNSDDPFKNPLDAISKLEETAKREDIGESFSDRKARYDRQREAKKAAEERRANASAKKDGSQEKEAPKKSSSSAASSTARTPIKKTSTSGQGSSSSKAGLAGAAAGIAQRAKEVQEAQAAKDEEAKAGQQKADAKQEDHAGLVDTGKPAPASADEGAAKKPTADELYGTKPRVKKPSGKRVPAPVKAAETASSEPVEKQVAEASDDLFEEGEE